jgi:hypothetical protein
MFPAFSWLTRTLASAKTGYHLAGAGLRSRDQWMVFINAAPSFDPSRSEPRFQALLRRMNFLP